ncbi:Ger(x)C family spore germination protein [Paenibacillus dokdonensis]|uniref:Ger(X)C family spore germination protein n=1 Tax=Paenibacillus dokdonensis TaxID=2567944 RepID=A0ABU6GVS2_9BACL|nr:Ger(x)C family spore germination protein [Paenibacillus dokdonensis]MEC0242471.1 Ger(x)C family spore germination protein [Paenibacillus dokdonensis]
MKVKLGWLPLLLLLTSCTDEHVLENAGFIRTIAYDTADKDDENLLRVTISIPKSNHQDAIVYSTIAKSDKNAKMFFDRQNNRKLVNGQLRQVLFGENLAKKGIWKHLDSLIRDPSIGTRLHVIVAEADPQNLLQRNDYPQGPTAGEYIDTLIRTEANSGEVPETNLYTFSRDYYDEGIDPVANILKEQKTSLIINGIALFKGDQYVGKIQPEERMYFGLLHHNVRAGDLYIDLKDDHTDGEQAALQFLSSHRKVDVISSQGLLNNKQLKVVLHIHLQGSLLEYIGNLDMKKQPDQRKLEREMQEAIQAKCKSLIHMMQEQQTDPLGIGQYVRNAVPHDVWHKMDWKRVYSDADISVRVNVRIKDYGKLLH